MTIENNPQVRTNTGNSYVEQIKVNTGNANSRLSETTAPKSAKQVAETTLVITEELIDDIEQAKEKKEKFESSKQYIQNAIDELGYIHNEIWNNFPQMYNATKDLDGTSKGGYDIKYDYKSYYDSDTYGAMAEIAAGKSEPWKDIQTGEDAARLISNILKTATGSYTDSYLSSDIDSSGSVNTGEMGVINKVLDELEKINDDTKAVAKIYREELEKAAAQSADWMGKHSMEATLEDNEQLKDYYVKNADSIEAQAREIESAKTAYEAAKAEFLENESLTDEERQEKVKDLEFKLNNYYRACNTQLINGNLNSWLVNPEIQITGHHAKQTIEDAEERIKNSLSIDIETPQEIESENSIETSSFKPEHMWQEIPIDDIREPETSHQELPAANTGTTATGAPEQHYY